MPTTAAPPTGRHDIESLFEAIENIHRIRDLESVLERVLIEARRFTSSDAGTLYLVARNRLHFSFVQNDSLYGLQAAHSAQHGYIDGTVSLPMDNSSLAGYVGSTGESLLIDNVYDIQSSVSYTFNPEFDRKSSYRTRSMLIVPLKTRERRTLGVLQLINKLDDERRPIPFSMSDRLRVNQFAQSAAHAIERAKLSREMVLRMIEVVALRDPFETGPHAKRVGAYSVELFNVWARKHGMAEKKIIAYRDPLRIGAILHDIGKVAVSDMIMKKKGGLDTGERRLMKFHTIFGARLFLKTRSIYDQIARQIALRHHERWDGSGYPGRFGSLTSQELKLGPGQKGDEIPVFARVVSIADVYDALISERVYKRAWAEDDVHKYLEEQKAAIFDPELVDLFLQITPIIQAIRKKYQEP